MTINFTDDMLREAVVRADIRELEAMPADHEIEHEFSKRFERRMKKLVRRSKTGNQADNNRWYPRQALKGIEYIFSYNLIFTIVIKVNGSA
jgi:hypothetical protein